MWLLRNIRMFKNWYGIYLWGETRLVLRNGLIINIHSKHDIPIIWEVIGTRCYGDMRRDAKTIVDIGANIGTFTLLALKETTANVYSYEPQSDNFRLLQRNIEENGFQKRVSPINMAVAGTAGERRLNIAVGGDSGHHSILDGNTNATKAETVECTTLNEIIREVGSIDFLKIDVEGAETEILESCTSWNSIGHTVTEEYYTHLIPV